MKNRNVILAISSTPCYLDKTETGYWVTKHFDKLSLRFKDEEEANWFVNTYHKGDKALVPTYVEAEQYFSKVK